MSFTQVNELRKNGQLNEAYEMAINDWNQAPGDKWAARALFWTLHDMAHAQLHAGDRDQAAGLAELMEQLLPKLGDDPETETDGTDNQQGDTHLLAERALQRLKRHLIPHYVDIKLAYRESKSGDTFGPFNYVTQLIAAGQLAEPLHERAGWIIWQHLWNQQAYIPALNARQALAGYMSLSGVERPSKLHSMMLLVALRLSKRLNEFDFTKFLQLWGTNNFMPEDWERSKGKGKGGKSFPSLVEQAVTRYIGFMKQMRDLNYSDDFMVLLNQAAERYDAPELKRYLSLALLGRGQKERAMELHRVLAQSLDRFYVWHELASMLSSHNLDLKTSALCKALTLKVPENYTCEIHRELGWELAREENMAAALRELETYSAVRERCGWPRTWRYDQLRKRIPADTVAAESNTALYAERARAVMDWVYQDVPAEVAIVVAVFKDKQGKQSARLALPGGRTIFLRANNLPSPDARYVRVRLATDGDKMRVLNVEAAQAADVLPAFADAVTGNVKVLQGQGGSKYGFVEGCFVPGQLLEGVADGDTLTILTEMQPDGRRRAIVVV